MAVNPKLKVTRDKLAEFIEDHETLIQFEKLINNINTLIPEDETNTSVTISSIQSKVNASENEIFEQSKLIDEISNTSGTNSRINSVESEIAELKKPLNNVISVAKSGGDFTTVEEALSSITDNTSQNRYTILVAPGVYEIDNSAGPVALKAFVGIVATSIRSVVFEPANPANNMFSGANFAYLEGIVFTGTASGWIVDHTVTGNLNVLDCVLRDCDHGFRVNGVNSVLEIDKLAVNNPGGTTTTTALAALSGTFVFEKVLVRAGANITTLIDVSGANTIGSLVDITTTSPNLTTAIKAYDGIRLFGSVITIVDAFDGFVIYGNDTDIRFDTVKLIDAQNDGFRIENTGTNINFSLFSGSVTGAGRFNYNVENPNCVVTGNGFTNIDNSYIEPGARVYAYLLDTKENDEGLNIIGELHVGLPEVPAKSILGSGDSYTRGMLVYTQTALGVFADVSTEARSASGSTFTFPGTAADNAIYIASSLSDGTDFLEHYGIRTIVDTAAVKGAGEIVIEYWDGLAWTEVNGMEVDADGDYFPHAKDYFQDEGGHHIRYDNHLFSDTWTKNDPMGLGTSYYWARFRIATAITSVPILQQFKLHSNSCEINTDGWPEYFGSARPIGQLPITIGGDRAFEGVVQSQSIWINQNLAAGLIENRFAVTNGYIGRYFFAPLDLDTSSPIEFIIAGRPTGTGTVSFTLEYDWVTEGDTAYTTNPGLSPGKKTIVNSQAVTAGQIKFYTFLLDVSGVVARREVGKPDFICISLHADTLSGSNFDIMALEANYTKWCEGGHV